MIKKDIDALILYLASPDEAVSVEAAKALGQLEQCSQAVFSALLSRATKHDDKHYQARQQAKESLYQLLRQEKVKPKVAVKVLKTFLLQCLKDDLFVYTTPISLLYALGEAGLDALLEILDKAPLSEIRDSVAAQLGQPSAEVVDKDGWRREENYSLESRRKRIVPALMKNLEYPYNRVRYSVLTSLRNLYLSGAVERGVLVQTLIQALQHDPNWAVRAYCANYLEELRDHRAIEPLLAVLQDDQAHWLLRKRCIMALRNIPCRNVGQQNRVWRVLENVFRTSLGDVRNEAAASLGKPEAEAYLQEKREKAEISSAILDGHGRYYSFLEDQDDDYFMTQGLQEDPTLATAGARGKITARPPSSSPSPVRGATTEREVTPIWLLVPAFWVKLPGWVWGIIFAGVAVWSLGTLLIRVGVTPLTGPGEKATPMPVVIQAPTPVSPEIPTTEVRVDDAPDDSHQLYPDLAVGQDGTLYAVWEDYRHGTYRTAGDIYFAYSTTGGQTWSANIRVNDDPAAGAQRHTPRLAVAPNGDLFVVWADYRHDPNPTDPGSTPEYSQNPDIYLAKLPAGQISFQPNVLVYAQEDLQIAPDVDVDGDGNVYVAWYDRKYDVHYGNVMVARSTDGGISFDPPVLADNHDSWALDPRLTINRTDNTIYIAYQGHPDYYKPYFTRSTNGGATWSSDVQLDAGPNRDWYDAAREIDIAVSSNNHLLVIWADERNDLDNCYRHGVCSSAHDEFDIYATYSTDGGLTWSADNIRVNDDSTYAQIRHPGVAFTPAGAIVAVWSDSRDGDTTADIYLATSTDDGASWSSSRRIDHADFACAASHPAVVVSNSGQVYAIWQDNRNGNWDIYLAR